jgi:hypothetical protein
MDQGAHSKLNDIFERYVDRYYSKKSRVAYSDEHRRKVDAHIIDFYRLTHKIKLCLYRGDYDITPILQDM